jgi:hypothetical protein
MNDGHIEPAKSVPKPLPTSKRFLNLTGKRFGKLTVIEIADPYVKPNGKRVTRWMCKCDCGTVKAMVMNVANRRINSSCGCARRLTASVKFRKHGEAGPLTKTAEYRAWAAMISRCENRREKTWVDYGGRGISVCDRWRNSFETFLSDMGRRPSGTSLDRINNSLGYSPENCRWATFTEQQRNKRNNHFLTFNGESLCISEWTERMGGSGSLIYNRLKKGWSIEKILTTPIQVSKFGDVDKDGRRHLSRKAK